MSAWPSSLPQAFLINGLQLKPGDPTIRSSVEAGEDKVRRRYTKKVDEIEGQIFIEGQSQYDTLIQFYDNNTSTRWDWEHPFTGTVKKFRFLSPPEPRPLSNNQWRVVIRVEVLV